MFSLEKCPYRLLLLLKLKSYSESGSGFSQIFDYGRIRVRKKNAESFRSRLRHSGSRVAGVTFSRKFLKFENSTPVQSSAGMSTDSIAWDWIRTEANFCRIRTGSDCKFLKFGGSGLDCTEKILLL